MIDMSTTIEQLAAQYADFSMDAKHRVLGEALYYLEVVESTHSIPGIEGVEVIANMNMWCYPPPWSSRIPQSVQACLAGIWYMARTQAVLNMCTLPTAVDSVMDYLDMVVTTTSIPTLHELVGLEVFSDDYDEASIIGDVQQRLQSLMDALPLMREGYDTAKGAAPYGGTSI
jgi:hypothetical protein